MSNIDDHIRVLKDWLSNPRSITPSELIKRKYSVEGGSFIGRALYHAARGEADDVKKWLNKYYESVEKAEAAAHTHDTLVAQVAELRGRLNDCVNDYIKNDKGDLTPSVFHRSAVALEGESNE